MTIDERVRDALHAYADPIEPAPGSWDRIESRLDERLPRERRPRTPLVLAGVGILLIVALFGVALVRDLDDGSNLTVDVGVAAPMPGRVLAVTGDGRMVVLDAANGKVLDTRAAAGTSTGESIAVSADGRNAYFVGGTSDGTCADAYLYRLPLDGPVRSVDPVATRASSPALSPDGRYLAYLRCSAGFNRSDEVVLRDLATGTEQVTSALPSQRLGGQLTFASDSDHVLLGVGDTLHRLDLVGGEALPGRDLGIDSVATPRGLRPDQYLVPKGAPSRVLAVTGPEPFTAQRLFELPEGSKQVEVDASGDHVLAPAADGALYRWSVGDESPTKVADGIIAAAWIPGSKPAEPEPEPAPSALPPQRVLVFGTTARGGGSMVVLPSTSRDGIGEMGSASDIVAGTPVAISDGFAYVVRKSVNSTCGDGDSIFRQPIASGARSGDEISNATAPAISPDGKYLAYLACRVDSDGPWLTVRDLQTGEEDSTFLAVDYDAARLQFSPDSSRLLVATNAGWSERDVVGGRLQDGGSTRPTGTSVAGYWGSDELVAVEQGRQVVVLPRAGLAGRLLLDGEWLDGTITDLVPNAAGNALLVIVDDSRLYWWAPGLSAPVKLDDKMLTAAWMPEPRQATASTRVPNGVLAAKVSGQVVSIGASDGGVHGTLATVPDVRWLSPVAPEGLVAAYGTESRNGACVEPRAEVGTIDLASQAQTRIVSGAIAPTVSPDGRLVAYGILCDGVTLGFSDLGNGRNYRTDPLPRGARTRDLQDIAPIVWAPDSKRLLYRAVPEGSEDPRFYVGRLWPSRTRPDVVMLPAGVHFSAATFVDDETLAIASDDRGRSRVRFVDLELRPTRNGGFETPGHVTQLTADATGRHFLAVTDRRELYRWSIGDPGPTKLADDVTSASWIPWS